MINDPSNNAGAALWFDGTAIYFQASKTSHPGFGNHALFVATRTKMKAEENRHAGQWAHFKKVGVCYIRQVIALIDHAKR